MEKHQKTKSTPKRSWAKNIAIAAGAGIVILGSIHLKNKCHSERMMMSHDDDKLKQNNDDFNLHPNWIKTNEMYEHASWGSNSKDSTKDSTKTVGNDNSSKTSGKDNSTNSDHGSDDEFSIDGTLSDFFLTGKSIGDGDIDYNNIDDEYVDESDILKNDQEIDIWGQYYAGKEQAKQIEEWWTALAKLAREGIDQPTDSRMTEPDNTEERSGIFHWFYTCRCYDVKGERMQILEQCEIRDNKFQMMYEINKFFKMEHTKEAKDQYERIFQQNINTEKPFEIKNREGCELCCIKYQLDNTPHRLHPHFRKFDAMYDRYPEYNQNKNLKD